MPRTHALFHDSMFTGRLVLQGLYPWLVLFISSLRDTDDSGTSAQEKASNTLARSVENGLEVKIGNATINATNLANH